MTTNDSEWQRMTTSDTTSGTTSHNEWQRMTTSDSEWQLVTKNDNDWQRVVISVNFPFFRIKKEPTTKHSKENSLNLEEDLEEGLLN